MCEAFVFGPALTTKVPEVGSNRIVSKPHIPLYIRNWDNLTDFCYCPKISGYLPLPSSPYNKKF